jgi:segregation and condensation protein B
LPEAAMAASQASFGQSEAEAFEAGPSLGQAGPSELETGPPEAAWPEAGEAEGLGVREAPDLKTILEGLIFVSDEPMSLERLKEAFDEEVKESDLEAALEELAEDWERLGRAFAPKKVAGGWQFRSRPSIAPYAVRLKGRSPYKLSKAAMETLAVIAYRQPVLRTEVEKVRGVDAGGVLRTLLEKSLVRISGRKDNLPGRPMLYSTTAKFLETFELPDLKSLPTIEEIERLCPPKPRLF